MEKKNTIKAANYGELLATVNDMELVSFDRDGGYQGKYMVCLRDKGDGYQKPERLFYYSDYYGSCSGCDWIEGEKDWDTGEIDYKKALDFCGDIKPLYIVPANMPLKFTGERYEGFKLI